MFTRNVVSSKGYMLQSKRSSILHSYSGVQSCLCLLTDISYIYISVYAFFNYEKIHTVYTVLYVAFIT